MKLPPNLEKFGLSTRRLYLRYILALSVIALLTVASQTGVQILISDQGYDSRVINIAGRQRMLSQKITKISYYIVNHLGANSTEQSKDELRDALLLWQSSHVGLQYGDFKAGLPGNNSEEIKKLFQTITPSYEIIVAAGDRILDPGSNDLEMNQALEAISANELRFLVGMNAIVFRYDLEANEKIEFARSIEIVLTVFILFVLLLEALFIFAPATRRIHNQMTKLAEREQDMETLFNASPSAMIMLAMDSLEILNANDAAIELTKCSLDELRNKTIEELFNGDKGINDRFLDKLKAGESFDEFEITMLASNQHRIQTQVSSRIVEQSGQYVYVLGISNVSELYKAQSSLEQHANFDMLTGLPNRWNLRNQLELELKQAARSNRKIAVLLLDLDNFKDVNDTLGHDVGDMLLKEVAGRLSYCVRESDIVARLGGDEFVIVIGEQSGIEGIERIINSILEQVENIVNIQNHEIKVSTSIGVTLYPDDATTIDDLIKNADQAMYAAKKAGRNRYNYFKRSMQEAAMDKMYLIRLISTALEQHQFTFHYQPIVALANGEVHKAEALIRWQHPTIGAISPGEFIPVAEGTNFINEIGDLAFREATKQVAIWRKNYKSYFQVSVNISAAQFRQKNTFFESWKEQLDVLQLSGNGITLEITEGLLLDAHDNVKELLSAFNEAGIEVAIDDFGTGYSSLSYIKKFDINYIKIDQSFIANMSSGSNDVALCEAIVSMAHKLGLRVIAEGVETEEQRSLLLDMGCDFAQGYLFSKALPAHEFELLLRDDRFGPSNGAN